MLYSDQEGNMNPYVSAEALVIGLLLIVTLVALGVQRLRIPYTVALVVVGLVISSAQPVGIDIPPELILALLIPPLVFEAAFHLNLSVLWRNLPFILLLAVPGVMLTMIVVGGVVAWGTVLPLPLALVFGALVAATDPVSVVAMFKRGGSPQRLAVIVEGESLLNDGTAIVVFNLAIASALTGSFGLGQAVVQFISVSAGGVIIGVGLGWLTSRLIAQIDDDLIETTLTTVLAFGSYVVADYLHCSGVLAVVAAGLVCGSLGPRGMSPTTRIVLYSFWDYVAFLANSLVFLLIGLNVSMMSLLAAWLPVICAIAAVLIARAVIVYGLGWLGNHLAEPMPTSWLHVINWSGLRGAICLVLALTLPAALGTDLDLLREMAFGVVLFTLVVQGTTMGTLVRRLRVGVRPANQQQYEMRRGRLAALRDAQSRMEELHREGLISSRVWDSIKPELTSRASQMVADVHDILHADPALEAAEMQTARRELLRAQRSAYVDLRRAGLISDDVFQQLVAEVDAGLTQDAPSAPEPEPAPTPSDKLATTNQGEAPGS
jgi:CPA1 family monovalent cation:H+ antiporter